MLGILATLAANVMHGIGHGPFGAAVAARPGQGETLVGSYELLGTLIPAVPMPDFTGARARG